MSNSLQDEALMLELLGDDAVLLQQRLDQFEASQRVAEEKKAQAASATPDAPTELTVVTKTSNTGKVGFDNYLNWYESELAKLVGIIDGHYPGRVDVQRQDMSLLAREKELIHTTFTRECTTTRINAISSDLGVILRGRCAARVIIHFPELTVKNSERASHVIKDMYILIELSGALNFIHGFRGIRTTKSYLEYQSCYSFSHLNARDSFTQNWSQFCLGSTQFSVLVGELRNHWDETKFEYFCIQLQDYLSWESLEGGPYTKIRDIGVNNRQARFQIPSSSQLQQYYNSFLLKYDQLPIQVQDTGRDLLVSIVKDREFWNKVTAVTAPAHILPYDPAHERTYEEDRTVNTADIVSLNKRFMNVNLGITYKGAPLRLSIEAPNEDSTKVKKERLAHETVRDFIANTLGIKLNEHLQNEFCSQ